MSNIIIRNAIRGDLEDIFKIERRSYPPELQAPHEVLRDRFEMFGIRVAEIPKEVIGCYTVGGFYTCVPVFLNWGNMDEMIKEICENRDPHYKKWFDAYKQGGIFNTLYVTSTAVSSEHQGKGIGKLLVKHSLDLAEEAGLAYRASVLRIPGYRKFGKMGLTIDDYLSGVKAGEITNPTLNLYLNFGFSLGKPIPDYEPDRTSMNYGILAYKVLAGGKNEQKSGK